MFRIRSAVALAAVICLASAAVATAASGPKVTLRGTTTVNLSSGFASALSSAGVSVSPTSPATGASQVGSSSSAGSSFSFPIRGGAVHSNPYTGAAYTEGGLTFSKGGKSASVNALVVLLNRNGSLDLTTLRRVGHRRVCASVYLQHRRQCGTVAVYKFVPLAQAPALSTTNGRTVSGTLDLTADGAQVIDTLTGSATVSAGDPLGRITVSPIRS
jgi:hypothetical protein